MIAARDAKKERAQAEGVSRVRGWLEGLLPDDEKEEDEGGTAPDGKETSVIVNQLACKEEGCPDVEVVISLLRAKPRPKLMFKIYKAAAELSSDEVEAELRKALAAEQAELAGSTKDAHSHDHAEKEKGSDHAHVHGPDCEHGHVHGPDCDHDGGHDHDIHEHGH
jgi:hypothetical protein